jgi:fructose-1,6-bisphosphatase/inositol monophosphatase family enzyme
MVQEAGGIVTDYRGQPVTPENCGNMVAAANQGALDEILPFLQQP